MTRCSLPKSISSCPLEKQAEEFLRKYQTDMPMLPFVAIDLFNLVKGLMSRFLKPTVLQTLTSVSKLLKIDLQDSDLHCNSHTIDVGFAADKLLKELRRARKVSERDILSVRLDTKQLLHSFVGKASSESAFPLQPCAENGMVNPTEPVQC